MIIDVHYDNPLTASEIAEKISYPKDKIYYHIKKLQSNGILIIAESQVVKGITQNKFINAAKKFEIDPSLIGEQKIPKEDEKEERQEERHELHAVRAHGLHHDVLAHKVNGGFCDSLNSTRYQRTLSNREREYH